MVFHQSVRNRSFSCMGIVVVIHTRSCWGDRHCVFFIDKQCRYQIREYRKKNRNDRLAPINDLSDCSIDVF
jgi:hypothetical protein